MATPEIPARLSDFDFALPAELIAQAPAPARSASRLLDATTGGRFADRMVIDLPTLIRTGDLVIFNDTRVVRSRLRGMKPSGGAVELLLERITAPNEALFQLRASHPPRPGGTIRLDGGTLATVIERHERFFLLRLEPPSRWDECLEQHGEVPLPPYIARKADESDIERYQTVYARHSGAVAAPTAGLHFDATLLDALGAAGAATAWLTLHVGAGTFLPIKGEDLATHRMHTERYRIPEATATAIEATRARGGRVLAVGTTTLRALESATDAAGHIRPGSGETSLFITPGFRFRVVDRLLTNFHLPKSTLLVLVSAFAGGAIIQDAYAHAIARRYRFFSYGDAMLLDRAAGAAMACR